MSDLNLAWDIPEGMFISPSNLEEFLGQLYDNLLKSKKYGRIIKEMYTREEYIETFSKELTQDRGVIE